MRETRGWYRVRRATRSWIACALTALLASSARGAGDDAGPTGAPRKLIGHLNGVLLTLSWQPPESGSFNGYRVEMGVTPGTTVSQGDVGLATKLPPISTPPGTLYFRVRARLDQQVGPPSNEVVVTVAPCTAPPGTPRNLRASAEADTVSFRWDPPSSGGSPAGYLFELGTAPRSADVSVADTGPSRSISPVTLPPDTYFARVRAYNTCGSGGTSNEVTFTTSPTPPPSAAWAIAIDSRTLREYCGANQPASFSMTVDGVTQTLNMPVGGPSVVSGFRGVPAEVPRQVFTKIETGCGSASGPSTTLFGKYCVISVLCAGDHPGDPYPPTWFTIRGNLSKCERPTRAELEQICRFPGG